MIKIDTRIAPEKLTTGEWGLPLLDKITFPSKLEKFNAWREQSELTEDDIYVSEYSVATMYGDEIFIAIIARTDEIKTLALLTFS